MTAPATEAALRERIAVLEGEVARLRAELRRAHDGDLRGSAPAVLRDLQTRGVSR